MSQDVFLEAVGYIDDDIIAQHIKLKCKYGNKVKSKSRSIIYKSFLIAAGLALTVISAFIIHDSFSRNQEPPLGGTHPPVSDSTDIFTDTDTETLLLINKKFYRQLSSDATEQNVGEFIGYVSVDPDTMTGIKVYEYVPDDGKTNKVIIPDNGTYYVYSFDSYALMYQEYIPNNNNKILDSAIRIEIRDSDNTVQKTITDVTALKDLLSGLDAKYTRHFIFSYDLVEYKFNKIKHHFSEGLIWIETSQLSQTSYIASDFQHILNEANELIRGDERILTVCMDDNTRLTYVYREGVGVIEIGDVAYILSEKDVELLNSLIYPEK